MFVVRHTKKNRLAPPEPPSVNRAFYEFEGDFQDSSIANNDLTAGTGASINSVIYANGTRSMLVSSTSNGAISTQPINIVGDFTIRAFVYKSSHTNVSGTIFSTRVSSSQVDKISFALNFSGFRFQLVVGTGTSSVTLIDGIMANAMPLSSWGHVVLERYNGVTKIFFNGNQLGSTSAFAAPLNGVYSIGAGMFTISGPTNKRPWNGYLDDVEILPTAEYQGNNFTPPVYTGTITQSFYNFNVNANDQSQFGRHLALGTGTSIDTNVGAFFSSSVNALGAQSSNPINLTGAFTIQCWFNANVYSSTFNIIFGMRTTASTDTTAIDFGINTSGTRFLAVRAGVSLINAVVSLSAGTWYHACLERIGNTVTVYLNGSSIGSFTLSAAINNTICVGSAKIAFTGPSNRRAFFGYIDDLIITNNAPMYGGNFTPPPRGSLG